MGAAAFGGESSPEPMMEKPTGDIRDVARRDPSVCAPDGIAVGGYDLVSYHHADGPQPGLVEFVVEQGEFRYLFVSERNKELFQQNPDRYLPEYSGWCAITLALGRLTCPDYSNFQIEDGKLFLFETTGFTNGRVLWNSDAPGFRVKADNNFQEVLKAK